MSSTFSYSKVMWMATFRSCLTQWSLFYLQSKHTQKCMYLIFPKILQFLIFSKKKNSNTKILNSLKTTKILKVYFEYDDEIMHHS